MWSNHSNKKTEILETNNKKIQQKYKKDFKTFTELDSNLSRVNYQPIDTRLSNFIFKKIISNLVPLLNYLAELAQLCIRQDQKQKQ